MQKILAALAAAALLAVAAPVNANSNDKNVDFLVAFAGLESIPEGVGTLNVNGETMEITIAEAFALAAERANGVDLAAIASAAAPGDATGLGDVWALEIGGGRCPAVDVISGQVLPGSALNPQAYVYNGPVGTSETSGSGIIIDWTTKGLTGGSYGSGMTYGGQSDFWCFAFFGIYILFPFIDGFAASN